MTLPGLELTAGVPQSLRTIVAVPTLLTSEADLLEQIERLEVHHLAGAGGDLLLEHIERLEVHHLAGPGGDLAFALLSDGVAADRADPEGDVTMPDLARESDGKRNQRYGTGA